MLAESPTAPGRDDQRQRPLPAVSITDETETEGGAEHTFDVTLSRPSSRQVKVDYDVADASATAPGDYTDESGQVIFTAGQPQADHRRLQPGRPR